MAAFVPAQPVEGSPFNLDNASAYRQWREAKLSRYPLQIDDLVVELGDVSNLDTREIAAVRERCRLANMALYKLRRPDAVTSADVASLGRQFGLVHLDRNYLAQDDGITALTVANAGTRQQYIPYTDRPIKWHTDGYYNPPQRQIRGLILHCVAAAAEGGENGLMDHEMAYILLRDENPDYIRALMAPDAMTIPARVEEDGVARGDQPGPVFSLDESGCLHMRYTARTRNVIWKDDALTRAAVAALGRLLEGDSPYVLRTRLEPGTGLICNNVLHDRHRFHDGATRHRLLYRARYYERVAGT